MFFLPISQPGLTIHPPYMFSRVGSATCGDWRDAREGWGRVCFNNKELFVFYGKWIFLCVCVRCSRSLSWILLWRRGKRHWKTKRKVFRLKFIPSLNANGAMTLNGAEKKQTKNKRSGETWCRASLITFVCEKGLSSTFVGPGSVRRLRLITSRCRLNLFTLFPFSPFLIRGGHMWSNCCAQMLQ